MRLEAQAELAPGHRQGLLLLVCQCWKKGEYSVLLHTPLEPCGMAVSAVFHIQYLYLAWHIVYIGVAYFFMRIIYKFLDLQL